MVFNGKYTLWRSLAGLLAIFLCQSVFAYGEIVAAAENQPDELPGHARAQPAPATDPAQRLSAANEPASQSYATIRKKTLRDESRGLSAFLLVGIGINIVMAAVFIWWFASEWRKSRKPGQSRDDG